MVNKVKKNSLFNNCVKDLEGYIVQLKAHKESIGLLIGATIEGEICAIVKLLVNSNLTDEEQNVVKLKLQLIIDDLSSEKSNQSRCREYLESMAKEI